MRSRGTQVLGWLATRRLRTHLLITAVPLIAAILVLLAIFAYMLVQQERTAVSEDLDRQAEDVADSVEASLRGIEDDIDFFEDFLGTQERLSYLETAVISGDEDALRSARQFLQPLNDGLRVFLQSREAYTYISIVGLDGRELLRVERDPVTNEVTATPVESLQDRSGTDIFQEGSQLRGNRVWMSDVRLQRDGTGSLIPGNNPVVNFVTPLSGDRLDVIGLLIFEADVSEAFAPVNNADGDLVFLIDQSGFFLGRNEDEELLFGRDLDGARMDSDEVNTLYDTEVSDYFFWEGDTEYLARRDFVEPLDSLGELINRPRWAVVNAYPTSEVWNTVLARLAPFVIATLSVIGLAYMLLRIQQQAIDSNVEVLYDGVQRFSAGDLSHRVPDIGNNEFGDLAETFNQSTAYVQNLIGDLEVRVRDRIRDLDLTAEITREVAGLRDVNLVLNRAINLIVNRFNFYHAQVFLVDDLSEFAVLVASTGEPGRRLLAKQHKLGVGSSSVIGRVTSLGVTVIAGDTLSTDVPWRPNEELPETRAEMALPLKVEDKVIGALDVQSQRPDAFTTSDIEVFQVLADQLAIAINNARLLEESTRRVDEIAQLNSRLTEEAWREFAARNPSNTQVGFRYDLMEVTEDDSEPVAGDGTAVPLTIRGIEVGTIETARHDLSEDEQALLQAVADRISLAIDNARLFEETQMTLSESRRLYETARTISASADLDIQSIYELVANQVSYQANLDAVTILLAKPIPSPRADHLSVEYTWTSQRQPRLWTMGAMLALLQQGLTEFYQQNPRNIIQFKSPEEISLNEPGYQAMVHLQRQLSANSLLVIPITTGLKWFGLLTLSSTESFAFDNSFINFSIAVADQLAIAIENRRLLEDLQNEARRSLALAEAGQLANQISGDFQAGVERLFQSVSEPGNFNRWWFGLLSRGNQLEVVTANAPVASDRIPRVYNLSTANNALTASVQLRQVILVNETTREHPLLGEISDSSRELFGRHLALPVMIGNDVLGALLIGRDPQSVSLNEDDIQLATTVASQLSIAIENQNLFRNTQRQQETLRTTLETMPAGVMLLDRRGGVLLTNRRAVDLLGEGVRGGFFAVGTYPIYYVDTNERYAAEDFPITSILENNVPSVTENISVRTPEGAQLDLLMNANAVRDAEGRLVSVVVVLQEITELRELERALQSSLSETTILYEASRNILGAGSTEELSSSLETQIANLDADVMYVITEDIDTSKPAVSLSIPATSEHQPHLSDIPLPPALLTPDGPVIIEDLRTLSTRQLDPQFSLEGYETDLRGLFTMPLRARGHRLGWLVIGYKHAMEFGPETRRFIASLADQTAVALDSIRLFESTERALQSVANLYQSSRRVAEAQGVGDVVEVINEELLNFQPDRIDLLLQRSAEDVENMYAAIAWASEPSLEYVPSLPIHAETAQPLAGFNLFGRNEYFIESFNNEPDSNELYRALYELDTPYQSVISVPLRVGGRTIGRIGMGWLLPRIFTADDHQLLTTLADSTAYVVENDLLLEQTQESLEETGVLYQASRTIANAETREEIVESLIDYAASAQVDKTLLISLMTRTWDEPGAVIEVTSTWGDEEVASLEGLYFTQDQFPIWDQLATDEILWIDDIDQDPHISDNARMGYAALGMASVAVVPLRTPAGIIGCIMFGSSEPRKHEVREVRIYQALADQAAVQLENKRLFDQAEFRARQLATSAEVSRAVTSILDLNELFPRVVDLILSAFEYDHVQIFLVDDRRENAVVRASTGEAGRQLLGIKHSLPVGSDSVIGRVTSVGKPVIALDTTDPEVVHRPNPYLPETRSEMAIPIIVQGRIIGALDVQSNKPQAFDEDDIKALTPLVDQLAVAIENARLFEFSQRRAEEMRFLFDVTSAAARETELTPSLQTVVEILIDSVEANATNVLLYDPAYEELVSQVAIIYEPQTGHHVINDPNYLARVPIGEGILGSVARNLSPRIVSNLQQEDRYLELHESSRSGIYVPLTSGEQLVGVLAMESDRVDFFDDGHLQLLLALSTSLAAIIRNAQLLEEVRDTNERLREIDQLKTNFLAAMSHELRTPLNSIIGFSRVILKGIDGPLTDMQEQDIQTIHDSGKHLLGLVNDILDQAKIEAGKMELVLDYFDLSAVINGVMSSAVGLTADKPVKLYTSIEEDLPKVFGDEFRTRQILFNLVSNAAKFTEDGSISIDAKVITSKDHNYPTVQVAVTDTGIGIAEKDYPHLFEAFQQVDNSTTRAVEGTGLGLPLSRSLARLQGGELWFESKVGVGSTFYVSLPLQPVEEGMIEAAPPNTNESQLTSEKSNGHEALESPQMSQPSISDSRRILAVDDDEEVIDLYKRYLSREGWNVIGTTDAADVEALAVEYMPEVILLDVNMPERTGWQVLEALKDNSHTSQIPVIICSIDDNRSRSEDLGAASHLVKPFMEGDLVKAVRDIATPSEA